ncbi:hypothetical protein ACWG5P_30350 [Streptomyces prasinus]
MDTAWYVLGTAERPKLYAYLGDPDSWDPYVLIKQGRRGNALAGT